MSHKKIRIIGSSGSGKSTLAQKIAGQYMIPIIDLDDIYFEHKYTKKRGKEEMKSMLDTFISKNKDRIIEGVYTSARTEHSFLYADEIIYCKSSKINLLYRLIKRELAKGNSWKNIFGLIKYALHYAKNNESLQEVLQKYNKKIKLASISNST